MSIFETDMPKKIVEIISSTGISKTGVSLFGFSAYYFYQVSKGVPFRFFRFFIGLFLALFVGYVVGKFLPPTIGLDIRDGLLVLAGFCTFPLLDILEKKGLFLLAKKIGIEDPLLINQKTDGK